MRVPYCMVLVAWAAIAAAQSAAPPVWQMQVSGTAAGLRGIDSVDGTVAWASGTGGTVLRTSDGGAHWLTCAVPDAAPNGTMRDFRGVQAWDAETAIVMASGLGDKSRLYKTTDGCKTWRLLYTNPDKRGFWDAMAFRDLDNGFILGDPVAGRFVLFFTFDQGKTWGRVKTRDLQVASAKVGAFAASNSALTLGYDGMPMFGTSGPGGPWLYVPDSVCTSITAQEEPAACFDGPLRFDKTKLPMAGNSSSAGVFSLAVGDESVVAVGGDYRKPTEASGTAVVTTAWSLNPESQMPAAKDLPRGYRSAVQWSESIQVWITVGTNGSDISRDDGKTWQPLDNGNWNALSLPFVVGPNGRIARLNTTALAQTRVRAQ